MTYWFVEVVANRVCESSDGVIEDEQILGLILGEGRHQHLHKQTEVEGEGREGGRGADLEDLCQVRHQLSAGLLFQSGKGRARSFLHSLVGIQDPLQQLYTHTHTNEIVCIVHYWKASVEQYLWTVAYGHTDQRLMKALRETHH